jgi:hypothetical protein
MIAINCTNCRHRLEMDDAFAGGVCRCPYCGTIQTVPSRSGGKGRPASPGSGSSKSKSLYKKEGAAAATGSSASSSSSRGTRKSATAGTGLDELAQIVASSGLARGSLTKKPPTAPPASKASDDAADTGGGSRFPVVPVAIGGGVVAVVVLALLIYFATRPSPPAPSSTAGGGGGGGSAVAPNANSPSDSANGTPEPPTPPAISGPAFADVALPSGTVVYLVDRSQANDEILDSLKRVVYASARSLGPSRAFQIIIWDRANEGIVAYPEKRPGRASEKEVQKATKRFEDVVSYGTTDLKPTLERALKSNPKVIVIASAKGFSLEESNAAMVKSLVKGKSVQIHTFAISETDSATLKKIAADNGGEYRQITPQQIREMAK